MVKGQLRDTGTKTIIFLNFLFCFLPWITEVFMPYYGALRILLLVGFWVIYTFLAQNFILCVQKGKLKKTDEVIRAIIATAVGIISAAFLSYFLIPDKSIGFIVTLGFFSIIVWMISIFLAGTAHYRNLIKLKYNFYGFIVLSLYAVCFRFNKAVIISFMCLLAYLSLSSVLIILAYGKKRKMVSTGIGIILMVGFLIGASNKWIGDSISWTYRNVISKALIIAVEGSGYVMQRLFIDLQDNGAGTYERSIERLKYYEKIGEIIREKRGKVDLTLLAWKLARTVLIIALMVWVFLIIMLLLYRFYHNKPRDDDELEYKKFIFPDFNSTETIRRAGRTVWTVIHHSIYGSSYEERIRKMFRAIVIRMYHYLYPVTKSSTPNEIMELVTDTEDTFFRTLIGLGPYLLC